MLSNVISQIFRGIVDNIKNKSYLCSSFYTIRLWQNKIEYLVLLVAAFATRSNVTEAQAYRYLSQYGALALCDKHYGIMHTLSLDENIQTLKDYCQRKGGKL